MRFIPKQKPGYHETPQSVLQEFVKLSSISCDPQAVTLFDPCAGTGLGVATLGSLLGVDQDSIYAVESVLSRFEACAKQLQFAHVLGPAAFENCSITSNTFSVALIHPPHKDEHGSGVPAIDMVRRALNNLVAGGIAIIVADQVTWGMPEFANQIASLMESGTFLTPWHDETRKMGALACVRRKKSEPYANIRAILRPNGSFKFSIPAGRHPSTWQKIGLSNDEVIGMLNRSPLMAATEPPEVRLMPSPPMELGRGHVALLLASGFLNGVIEKPGEPPHVVRGTARKVEALVSTEDSHDKQNNRITTKIYSEKIELHVRILTDRGTIHELSSGTDKPAEG